MDRERKKGRMRQGKAWNSFVCRVKHDFYKCSWTCPLAQCRLVNTAALGPSSLKGVLAFAYPWVCVYSEWVGQKGFWSETHRSSDFEGDHPSNSLSGTSIHSICMRVHLSLHTRVFSGRSISKVNFLTMWLSVVKFVACARGRPAMPDATDAQSRGSKCCKRVWWLLKRGPIFAQSGPTCPSFVVAKMHGIGRTLMHKKWRKRESGIEIRRRGSTSRWLPETLTNTYKRGDGDNK